MEREDNIHTVYYILSKEFFYAFISYDKHEFNRIPGILCYRRDFHEFSANASFLLLHLFRDKSTNISSTVRANKNQVRGIN
jgi:hypothetical protein